MGKARCYGESAARTRTDWGLPAALIIIMLTYKEKLALVLGLDDLRVRPSICLDVYNKWYTTFNPAVYFKTRSMWVTGGAPHCDTPQEALEAWLDILTDPATYVCRLTKTPGSKWIEINTAKGVYKKFIWNEEFQAFERIG